jgi:hypothetical protein
MSSNNKNFDISLENNKGSHETELVEVNPNNLTGKESGYSYLNNNESEGTISTEFAENNDNSEDFTELKEQFNNSVKIKNPLVVKKESQKEIKYRKGRLHTFFYDKRGVPKIVLGPDCKCLLKYNLYMIRGLFFMYASIRCNTINVILWSNVEIYKYFYFNIWNIRIFIFFYFIYFNKHYESRNNNS